MKTALFIILAWIALIFVIANSELVPTDKELEHQYCDGQCECDGLGCDDDMHQCMEYEDSTENPD